MTLNTFNNDPALPHIPGGLEDFFEREYHGLIPSGLTSGA